VQQTTGVFILIIQIVLGITVIGLLLTALVRFLEMFCLSSKDEWLNLYLSEVEEQIKID
jgi:hypothetical protein